MESEIYEGLKLKNQLCFPLYACAKEMSRRYKPYLDKLDLTYTQYIAMMVIWEKKQINVRDLGEQLYLDSGTLTPLLKKLESKGYITRERSKEDERSLNISISEKGEKLKEKAVIVPQRVGSCISLEPDKAIALYKTLYELLDNLTKNNTKNNQNFEL
ncbi:MAG: MarR family transcriptional regulator [Ruminococcus sp.]|nr:MarR family transcriptional regulator [Ruminococcus sp.]